MNDLSTRDEDAYLRRETYVPLVDTDFRILPAGTEPVVAKLAEVSEPRMRGSMEYFSLIFVTEPLDGAESSTYAVEHPEIGKFDIFLSPIGRAENGGLELEAIFSRQI